MWAPRGGLAWCWCARELRLLPQVESNAAEAETASGERARAILNGVALEHRAAAAQRPPTPEPRCWRKVPTKRCTLIIRPLPWPLRNGCHDRNGAVDAELGRASACRRPASVLPALTILRG